jgi:hypothetical protein
MQLALPHKSAQRANAAALPVMSIPRDEFVRLAVRQLCRGLRVWRYSLVVRIGYGRVSGRDQRLEAQYDLLRAAGCEEVRGDLPDSTGICSPVTSSRR